MLQRTLATTFGKCNEYCLFKVLVCCDEIFESYAPFFINILLNHCSTLILGEI